ncbi:MAG: hypothetical protein ACYC1P_09355 [Gaiellaceae bacterium]
MTTPIHLDRTGASPADTQKDGCCGGHGHAHAEGESRPKDEGEGCCGGAARSEPRTGRERDGCCGGRGHGGQ